GGRMICPLCGFEQTQGLTCSQCQTRLSSTLSPAVEGAGEGQISADRKKEVEQSAVDGSQSEAVSAKAPAPSSTADGSAGGEEMPDPSLADSEAVVEQPVQQVEERSHDLRPEKPGPRKKHSASGRSGGEPASAKIPSLSSASGRSRGEVDRPAPGPERAGPTKQQPASSGSGRESTPAKVLSLSGDKRSNPPQADSESASDLSGRQVREKTPSQSSGRGGPAMKQSPSDGVRERIEQLGHMIVTTTPGIEGGMILAYHGIVTATVLVKGDLLIRKFLQGILGEVASIRSSSLEEPLERAKTIALTDLKVEAAKKGANAVVGLTMSQAPVMEGVWLNLVGTAVTLKE
ncbi:MAG: heavy metal-binding domain-containing protein, partial [Nitrospiria bacterium]